MTFIGKKLPQMVDFKKWIKYRICDISEIFQVLETSMKLECSSSSIVRTHFKVNGERHGVIVPECFIHCIETGGHAQQS